jgi:hypothetical protein
MPRRLVLLVPFLLASCTSPAPPTARLSRVQQSTLGDDTVEQCIAQAIERWTFPKPSGGGIVIVSYPFVLKTSPAAP